MKRYKLRIPDGCKVESVNRVQMKDRDMIVVVLAPEFDPKPGDYVVTGDGQVGIKTKDGYFRFKGGANFHFTKYANDTQKKVFDELMKESGLMYDRYSEDVIELPKEGDLCIFWDGVERFAYIRIFKELHDGRPKDTTGSLWRNYLKFVSEEQFKKLISE